MLAVQCFGILAPVYLTGNDQSVCAALFVAYVEV